MSPFVHVAWSSSPPTTRSTNFGGYTVDQLPNDWTARWAGFTAEVKADAGALGGKRVEYTGGSSGRLALSWDELDALAGRLDAEVLAKIMSTNSNIVANGVATRGSGATGSEYGYVAHLRNNDRLRIIKYVNNTGTTLGDVEKAWVDGDWWWVRLRVNTGEGAGTDSRISVKFWKDGTSEPGSWDNTWDDDDVPNAGWIGLYTYVPTAAKMWDYFAVGLGGATAPGPA